MARAAFLAALLALLPPSGHLAAQTQGLDRAAIARAVVARMALRPGEKVLFVGRPGVFDTLTAFIRRETTRAEGAEPLGGGPRAVIPPGPTPSDPASAAMQDVRGPAPPRPIHFHWAG